LISTEERLIAIIHRMVGKPEVMARIGSLGITSVLSVTREESATISQTQRIIPEWAALATPYHTSVRCGSLRLRRQVLFKVA